jgi:hypothetical protein
VSESCSYLYKWYSKYGYKGGPGITYQDLFNWAHSSDVGWEHFCAAMLGGADWSDCNTNPLDGHQRVLYKSDNQLPAAYFGVTAAISCTLGAAPVCLGAIAGGVGTEADSGIEEHAPAGEIVKVAAVTAIVMWLGRAIDGAMDYEMSEEEEESAWASVKIFSGGQLLAVKAAAVYPENIYGAVEIYRAFNSDGEADPNSVEITTVGGNGGG